MFNFNIVAVIAGVGSIAFGVGEMTQGQFTSGIALVLAGWNMIRTGQVSSVANNAHVRLDNQGAK